MFDRKRILKAAMRNKNFSQQKDLKIIQIVSIAVKYKKNFTQWRRD